MVTVTIAGEERSLGDVSERWINRSINRAKSQNLPVCVRVEVHENGLNLNLTTPGCTGGGGGGRPPNHSEGKVISLWRQQGLDSAEFRGGNVIAFLQQLQSRYL